MALQFSVAVRNARADATEIAIGVDARLRVLTGSPPANAAAAETGTLLCEVVLPTDWMAAAATGIKAKAGTWEDTGAGTGTAGYFRVYDAAVSACGMQGTCGGAGSGADMEFDNPSIAPGQDIVINTFTLTEQGI